MNIIILGGGIAGLLGAYALRRAKPTIIEASGKLGGNFAAGGLKYIHDTPEIRQLLRELELPFEPYHPRAAIHVDGMEWPHPDHLMGVSPMKRYQIQFKHWIKTRASSIGFREDCMNNPTGDHAALRCDHIELMRRLERKVRDAGCEIRLGSTVHSIAEGNARIHLQEGVSGVSMGYDILIPTLPLGLLSKLAPWASFPTADVTKLAIFELTLPIFTNAWDYDYMYTPEAKWVSRLVWPNRGALMAEVPWHLPQGEAYPSQPTLNSVTPWVVSILKDTFGIEGVCTDSRFIPGHLQPLTRMPDWPADWFPLGRFAQWDSRATADKVYARALAIASGIGA